MRNLLKFRNVYEHGNRIDEEQFYLTYLIDYSEKPFAQKLMNQINSEIKTPNNLKSIIGKVAKERNTEENMLFGELLLAGLVDSDMNVIPEK
ncbi:MAG: hypothetical protein PHX08_12695 [Lachnospiraceae bacterium]|nr:hypothetical protein [Lachnospiraceae bacterium]